MKEIKLVFNDYMLNDRFNAKLRVASMDLMTGKPIGDDMKLWAVSVTMMYLGRLTNINADELSKSFPEYKAQMKYEMPGEIEKSVLEALTGKLSSWMQVFKNLGEWHFRDIPDGYHSVPGRTVRQPLPRAVPAQRK